MIQSAQEFYNLRNSDNLEEQNRASNEEARIEIWKDVVVQYPEMKEWVIHNKTIQIEVLRELCHDENPKIRECVARKRKINTEIFDILKNDDDENVRFALMSNTKLSFEAKKLIKRDDSDWLQKQYEELLIRSQKE